MLNLTLGFMSGEVRINNFKLNYRYYNSWLYWNPFQFPYTLQPRKKGLNFSITDIYQVVLKHTLCDVTIHPTLTARSANLNQSRTLLDYQ